MIEEPLSPWTTAEDELAAALPLLAAFQEFCEAPAAGPEAHAARYVFLEELGESPGGERWTAEELAEIRHYALVSSARENAFRFDRITADGFRCSGTLTAYFDRRVPPEQESYGETLREAHQQQDRWLKNRVGLLLMQLAEHWHQTGGPWIQWARVASGPLHTHPDERETTGHWQSVEVEIGWGEPAASA